MIKVMIVDDEFLVRVGMKSVIDWEYYGFEICAEAADGMEALALCETQSPDIILTDLRMPHMDGMELIRRVKAKYPEVYFIILTCLDELNLVKEALILGASGYFIKIAVNPQAILEILLRIKATIQQSLQKANELASLKKIMVNNRILLKRQLLQALLSETALISEKEIASPLIRDCAIYEKANIFILIRVIQNQTVKDAQLFCMSIFNLLEEMISNTLPLSEVFPVSETEFLVSGWHGSQLSVQNEIIQSLVLNIRESIRVYFGTQCFLTTTDHYHSFRELPKAYQELKTDLNREMARLGHLPQNRSGQYATLDEEIKSAIANSLKTGDQQLVLNIVERLFADAKDQGWEIEQLKKLGLQVMFLFEKELQKYDQSIDSLFAEDLIGQLMGCQSEFDLHERIDTGVTVGMKALIDMKSNLYRKDIQRIIDLLETRYAEKINLDYAASLISMNSAYFSRLFKKECGIGFVEYLNKVRMEKAKIFLEQNDCKLLEVADKVGFEDVNYFSKCFKRYTGMAPSEYRLTHSQFLHGR